MDSRQQISFLKKLLQCRSITPKTERPIDLIIQKLSDAGFSCEKLVFADDAGNKVTNLYAHYGMGEKNLCFAGHADVVPPGNQQLWHAPPFRGIEKDGKIYGRGAVDMKGGIASFVAAALQYIKKNSATSHRSPFKLGFLISGDEEWESKHGMIKLLGWLTQKHHKITACLVGEPTSKDKIGDTIKIGSRGSFLFDLTVRGTQGHVAHHKHAKNPLTALINILHALKKLKLDDGTKFFEPSNLEITNLDVNNPTTNIIPAQARAQFCIRFNDMHSQTTLSKLVHTVIKTHTNDYSLLETLSGEAYRVTGNLLIDAAQKSIMETQGFESKLSTEGATSDARFIKSICPAIELGPLIETAHKRNEHIALDDLLALTKIYYGIIENFFKK